MEDKMKCFIDFIGALYDDLFYEKFGVDHAYYFTHGGCYNLAKIVKFYCPEAIIMTNENNDHCVISYNNKLYDINPVVPTDKYRVANERDILEMENGFGQAEVKSIVLNTLVNEIPKCRIDNLISDINAENENEKSKTI